MYAEGRRKIYFKELAHMIIRAEKSEVCSQPILPEFPVSGYLEIQVKCHSLELQKTSILSFKDFN